MIEGIISLSIIGIVICILVYSLFNRKKLPVLLDVFELAIKRVGLPLILLFYKNDSLVFIVDTGSTFSHISTKIIDKYKIDTQEIEGNCIGAGGEIKQSTVCTIDLQKDDNLFKDSIFCCSASLDTALATASSVYGVVIDGLIGNDFLDKNNIIIDYNNYTIKKA